MCWIVFGLAHVCGDCVPDRREVGRMCPMVCLFSLLLSTSTLRGYTALFSLIVGLHVFTDIWLFSLLLSASVAFCPPYAVVITDCS